MPLLFLQYFLFSRVKAEPSRSFRGVGNFFFTGFSIDMKVTQIQSGQIFRNEQQQPKRREFIDKLSDAVTNPRDVNDCVAVPRGIFKAYLLIMGGFGLLGISGALPAKLKNTKMVLNIAGNVLNVLSAIYFAKPFAVRGLSPTVKREDVNN